MQRDTINFHSHDIVHTPAPALDPLARLAAQVHTPTNHGAVTGSMTRGLRGNAASLNAEPCDSSHAARKGPCARARALAPSTVISNGCLCGRRRARTSAAVRLASLCSQAATSRRHVPLQLVGRPLRCTRNTNATRVPEGAPGAHTIGGKLSPPQNNMIMIMICFFKCNGILVGSVGRGADRGEQSVRRRRRRRHTNRGVSPHGASLAGGRVHSLWERLRSRTPPLHTFTLFGPAGVSERRQARVSTRILGQDHAGRGEEYGAVKRAPCACPRS